MPGYEPAPQMPYTKMAVGAMNMTLRLSAARALMIRTRPEDLRTNASPVATASTPQAETVRMPLEDCRIVFYPSQSNQATRASYHRGNDNPQILFYQSAVT